MHESLHVRRLLLPLALGVGLAISGCESSHPVQAEGHASVTAGMPTLSDQKAIDLPGVHNVVAYGNELYSGSAPEGVDGLATLAKLGIRTVISVDGAQPEAEEAGRLGMRYVHLPIGYDGMDDTRRLELARAVRDLPGPIYVHCHHGKHRSAAAAAAIGVTLGWLDNELALQRMTVSGTAPNYKGLYACASDTKPASQGEIDRASAEFPAHWKTSGLVQNMVTVDEVNELLKEAEKAGWQTPSTHPDLLPAAEAGRLTDLVHSLADDPEARALGQGFLDKIAQFTATASAFETALSERSSVTSESLSKSFQAVQKACKDCHSEYRD